jgi:hypothetical protein
MKQHTTPSLNAGFSTIELLIAFSVGMIFLTAAIMVSYGSGNEYSFDSGQAAALDTALDNDALATSSNKIDSLIAQISANWDAVVSGDNDFYDNTAAVVDVAPCLKELVNDTTWSTLGSRARTMTFGTALSNINIAAASGRRGCDPLPPGDWDNPDTFGSFDPQGIDNANAGIAATAIATKAIDGRLYAFLTSQHASMNVPDFWIVDVTDGDTPTYESSLDINNGIAWGGGNKEGANGLVVVGDYAYVLRNYEEDQLQVIDISDLDNPALVTPAISFEPHGVQTNGSDPQGEVIRYYNGKLYIGLRNTVGPELLVFDIETDPEIPTFIGAIANNFNHSIYDIAIDGTYAYLAIKPGTGGGAENTKELMVINIAGATPIDTGAGYNANAANNDTAGATAIYVLGNKLYLGREQVNNPKKDFYIFDISAPAAPTLISATNLGQASNSTIEGIYVSKNLAFLGTTKNPEFQIWDVSDPLSVVPFSCGGLNFPQEISSIAYGNNYIFASIRSNDFFRIIHDETSDATCN